VASQQFAAIVMIAATAKKQMKNQWAMATESWCQWRRFLHQLLCRSEQSCGAVGRQQSKREAISARVVCNLICWSGNGSGKFGLLHHFSLPQRGFHYASGCVASVWVPGEFCIKRA